MRAERNGGTLMPATSGKAKYIHTSTTNTGIARIESM